MYKPNYLFNGIFIFIFLLFTACSDDSSNDIDGSNNNGNGGGDGGDPPVTVEYTIWTGEKMTFSKNSGADPSEETNQDRITEKVWITRGNSGGQIFNAFSESSANENTSPAGTQWAIGTTDNIDNLTFKTFRGAVTKPKDVVGKNLVLLIPEGNIAIDIKFTSWASGKNGGFSYERSTKP